MFEIVHEKAWPITIPSLSRNIKLGYDVFPIETLDVDVSRNTISARHDAFQDPTTLSNLYHKLQHGFYDDYGNPNEKMLNPKARISKTISQHLATFAKEFLQHAADPDTNLNELFNSLARDQKNAEEFTSRPIMTRDESQVIPLMIAEAPRGSLNIEYNPNKTTVENLQGGGKSRTVGNALVIPLCLLVTAITAFVRY